MGRDYGRLIGCGSRDPAKVAGGLRDIHRICGQVCGQAASIVCRAAFPLPRRLAAEKLSNEKNSQIKGLREYVGFVTGMSRCRALFRALVDFQYRANRVFSHD
jgi:hypothetical protein